MDGKGEQAQVDFVSVCNSVDVMSHYNWDGRVNGCGIVVSVIFFRVPIC